MLSPGARFGSYEVLSPLGAGGMGEVYRARDLRLKRDVALKVLPPSFVTDPERLARFHREAELLASISHPNIAAIYGVEESAGTLALVMELVDGFTLADRLAHHGPLAIDEALTLAIQIAEAIDASHERGVVHRDLKPANINVTPDGIVKVLDFGLAKAVSGMAADVSVSQSPTLTASPTLAGVILGTAAYMSPEQARGVVVDRRTDIWAFGCVLFEMLTGRQAFGGAHLSDVIAAVLKSEPAYDALPPDTPPRLRAAIAHCLEKDPKRRWRDIADVRWELAGLRERAPADEGGLPKPRRSLERLAWGAVGGAAIMLAAVLAIWFTRGPGNADAPAGPALALELSPASGAAVYAGSWIIPFAISPDGRRLAYLATSAAGPRSLWIRDMATGDAQPIVGSDGAFSPFWSSDSKSVAFTASNALFRVEIPGGTPQLILRGRESEGASWRANGVVLVDGGGRGLSTISVEDGTVTTLTTPAPEEPPHRWPQFAGDGRRFLYTSGPTVFARSLDGGQPRVVFEMKSESVIRYADGHLFFVDGDDLWAQPLDESTLQVRGSRRRVARGVPTGGPGAAPFSVSESGIVVYWTQPLIQPPAQLQWMDRAGNVLKRLGDPAEYDGFDLSPDGRRIAAGLTGTDVTVIDAESGTAFPPAFNSDATDTVPIWSGLRSEMTFLSRLKEGLALRQAAPDGNSTPQTLFVSPAAGRALPGSWNRTGDQLVYDDVTADNGSSDLAVFHTRQKRSESLTWNTRFDESSGRLSPDDRWIAYITNQSGRPEVWVAAYPSGEPRQQISQGRIRTGTATEASCSTFPGRASSLPCRSMEETSRIPGWARRLPSFRCPVPSTPWRGGTTCSRPTQVAGVFLWRPR
jgi:Tol biopolymer transport system component